MRTADGLNALTGHPRPATQRSGCTSQSHSYGEGGSRTYGVPIQIHVGLNSDEVVVRTIGSGLHMGYYITSAALP